jgi:hypothetical protein
VVGATSHDHQDAFTEQHCLRFGGQCSAKRFEAARQVADRTACNIRRAPGRDVRRRYRERHLPASIGEAPMQEITLLADGKHIDVRIAGAHRARLGHHHAAQ